MSLEFDGEKIIITKDVDDMLEKLIKEIEVVTNGEKVITLDTLNKIDELEGVFLENCGNSGTGEGVLYTMYVMDNFGEKTETEIGEVIVTGGE